MFGIGKSKKIADAEKTKSDIDAREAALEAREAALPDVVTEIFISGVCINNDGSGPCFAYCSNLTITHKGLSFEDIAKNHAMEYDDKLEKIDNDADECTIVYSRKDQKEDVTIISSYYYNP